MKIRRTKADDLFSRYIRQRDKVCQSCGTNGRLECAHIYSRRHWATRHDPDNAMALCFVCHAYFTGNPVEFTRFCEARMGKKALDALYRKAHAVVKKTKADEAERVARLRELLDDRTGG